MAIGLGFGLQGNRIGGGANATPGNEEGDGGRGSGTIGADELAMSVRDEGEAVGEAEGGDCGEGDEDEE